MQRFVLPNNDTISLKKKHKSEDKNHEKTFFTPKNGVWEVEIVLDCLSSKPLCYVLNNACCHAS